VVILLLTLILSACGRFVSPAVPEEMPEDFDFSLAYGVGKKNEINTFKGRVTKDLIEDGSAEVDISFSDEEMADIYEKMKDIKVLEKKNFKSKCQAEPREETEWKITLDGETITHSIEEFCEPVGDAKQFLDLQHDIVDIVEAKEEYQSLPEVEGGYD